MRSESNLTRRLVCLAALLIAPPLSAAEERPTRSLPAPPARTASVVSSPTTTGAGSTKSANALSAALPALPPGVTELKFSEFFRHPIGPRGLEFTDKLRNLDGKRVRVAGYMVRQSQPVDRCLLLSPLPLTLHEDEYGFAEDLPATILHVFTAPTTPAKVPFTPGVLLLTGTLSLGNRAEPDGRVSVVRLQLDPPTVDQRLGLDPRPGLSSETVVSPTNANSQQFSSPQPDRQ